MDVRHLTEDDAVQTTLAAAEAGLRLLEQGGDFADGVVAHEAERRRCDRLVTFERRFARATKGAATLLTAAD